MNIDSAELADVDWDHVASRQVDLDPALLEQIRSRHRLKQLTLRVAEEQIAKARRVAAATGSK